jgi:hypothetical protein
VVFYGESAGGLGMFINIDYVHDFLRSLNPDCKGMMTLLNRNRLLTLAFYAPHYIHVTDTHLHHTCQLSVLQ